jgi:hypothetical protein
MYIYYLKYSRYLKGDRCNPPPLDYAWVEKTTFQPTFVVTYWLSFVFKDCRVGLPGRTDGQDCRAGLLGRTAGQDCQARLPGKTAGQDCRARLPGKTAGQDCRARLPGKTAGQVSTSLNTSPNEQV